MTLLADAHLSAIDICIACDFREDAACGPCACSVSGRDITEHAAKRQCPLHLYDQPKSGRRRRSAGDRGRRYQLLLAEAIHLLPPMPACDGSGVVLLAGGDFPELYASAKLAAGPVEVWHWPGTLWPWMRELLDGLNHVTVVNVADRLREHPAVLHDPDAIDLKTYALVHSRFADVTFVDDGGSRLYRKSECGAGLQLSLWRREHGLAAEFPAVSYLPRLQASEAEAAAIGKAVAARKKHLILCRLESNGDILVLLPALKYLSRDYCVTMLVYEKYLPLLDGIPWLRAIGVPARASREDALKRYEGAGSIRDAMPDHRERTWSLAAWVRTGVPDDLYDVLPLEVDNRDYAAEKRIVDRYFHADGGKPLILFNTVGRSSPYEHGDMLRASLIEHFGDAYQILDLAFVRADRIIDLLGLFERAACIITTDTGTLHLAYATQTPTIALARDREGPQSWGASEPRRHWILRMPYSVSATESGLKQIREAIHSLFHLPEFHATR